jgi:DNA-binding MarR family transcriptional regulator
MDVGHDLAMALRAAYLSMHRQADAVLAEFELTANQFVLLCLLEQEDHVSQQELCQRGWSDPNTVRPMLISLEKRQYVRRAQDPADGRAWCLILTTKGRRAVRKARDGSNAFRQRLTKSLSKQETEHLLELLGRMVDSMSDPSCQLVPSAAMK